MQYLIYTNKNIGIIDIKGGVQVFRKLVCRLRDKGDSLELWHLEGDIPGSGGEAAVAVAAAVALALFGALVPGRLSQLLRRSSRTDQFPAPARKGLGWDAAG